MKFYSVLLVAVCFLETALAELAPLQRANPQFVEFDQIHFLHDSSYLFSSTRIQEALAVDPGDPEREGPFLSMTRFDEDSNPIFVTLPATLFAEALDSLRNANLKIDVDRAQIVELSYVSATGATAAFVVKNWKGILNVMGSGVVSRIFSVIGGVMIGDAALAATKDEVLSSPRGLRYFLNLPRNQQMEEIQRNPDLAAQVLVLQSLVEDESLIQ